MNDRDDLATRFRVAGVSRRSFLKFCLSLTAQLALPASLAPLMAKELGRAKRQSVVWLSFQECTGCTESLTRSSSLSIENLIFNFISLDYHHTLQAAAGEAAESARVAAMDLWQDRYLLVVDGSVPAKDKGVYSTIAGTTNLEMLATCARDAAAVIAVGTCAAFGGLPAAGPNPTGAVSVGDLMNSGAIPQKPLINIPGCPPLPTAITATLAHYLVFGRFPERDDLERPLAIYGNTVHDRCPRLAFYQQKKFARRFDDEGARKGWCLYELGCKGPLTHNACATVKWNDATSFPIESGHPCLGCSEPGFWDKGGFYASLLPGKTAQTTENDGVEAGKAVFENNCAYCHSTGLNPFRAPPDQVPQQFGPGASGVHRFAISSEELESLVEYLESMQGGIR